MLATDCLLSRSFSFFSAALPLSLSLCHSEFNQHTIQFHFNQSNGCRMKTNFIRSTLQSVSASKCRVYCPFVHVSTRPTYNRHEFAPCMIYEEWKRFTYSYAKLIANMQRHIGSTSIFWLPCRFFFTDKCCFFECSIPFFESLVPYFFCLLDFNKVHENAINISKPKKWRKLQPRYVKIQLNTRIRKLRRRLFFLFSTNHLSIANGFVLQWTN